MVNPQIRIPVDKYHGKSFPHTATMWKRGVMHICITCELNISINGMFFF
jgi:hypothetical protein